MTKLQSRECPRCGQLVNFWCNRQVCVSCRLAELQTPEHKAKSKVWQIVNRAIKSGNLIRAACEVCGAERVDAHHDDYTKPLAVRWLCRTHHRQHHKSQSA